MSCFGKLIRQLPDRYGACFVRRRTDLLYEELDGRLFLEVASQIECGVSQSGCYAEALGWPVVVRLQDFLADTLGNFNQIWLQPNGRLLLVKAADPKQVGVVELQPSKGFYGLTTAYPERKGKDLSKKATLIWERSEPVSTGTGNPGAPSSPPAPQSSSGATVAHGAPNQLDKSISQTPPRSNPKPRELRSEVDRDSGKGGGISPRTLAGVIDYGRSLFFRSIRYVDWARRMVRDLGGKIDPHLRRIWQFLNEGFVAGDDAGSSRRNSPEGARPGIEGRSPSQPRRDAAPDPEGELRMRMAEWKRRGAQESIREEAAASRAEALREKLNRTEPGPSLEESLLGEIADFGHQIRSQGMDYFDWSMRMARDLGDRIIPHLRTVFNATHGRARDSHNAAGRLLAGAKSSFIVRDGKLLSIDEGGLDSSESESSSLAKHLPEEVATYWESLYRPGMSYLEWARLAMAGQPSIHASSLATIWNERTGHDHVVPAESLEEAKTRIDALVPEWQNLKEFEAFLQARTPDPTGWQLIALRARLEAISYEVGQILTVPATEKPKVSIRTNRLPPSMQTNIERGREIVEKFVAAKLGPFELTVVKNEEENCFERFDDRLSIMYLRPDVSPDVVAHEIAHDIEARHPEINKATRAFLMKRKEEGKSVKLSELTKKPEHTDDVHLDKWTERGGRLYTGRDYPSGYTEILSTGIQRLVTNPAAFRAQDPEHFELVVKILRGG